MKIRLNTIEYIFIIISMILLSGGFLSLIRASEIQEQGGTDNFQQIIYLLIYLTSLASLVRGKNKKIIGVMKNIPLSFYFLCLIILLSVFWSIAPQTTLRREIALFGSIIFSFHVYNALDKEVFLQVLVHTFIVIAVSCFIFIFIFPEYGIMYESGYYFGEWQEYHNKWQGIFNHKNALGRISSLGIVFFFTLLLFEKKSKIKNLTIIGLLSVLLIGSNSSTAIAITIFCIVALLVINKARKIKINKFFIFLALFSLIVLVLLSLILYYESIVSVLGKETSLTGRVPLWISLYPFIKENFLFGTGFDSFWLTSNPHTLYLWRVNGWEVPHAHNGFIDTILNLGIFGAILLTWLLLRQVIIGLSLRKIDSISMFFLIYLVFLITYNLSESFFLRANSIFTVLMVLSLLYLRNHHLTPPSLKN